jgi:hypothetical protein
MGGGGSEKQTITNRYADYLESAHHTVIDLAIAAYGGGGGSPYGSFGGLDFDSGIASLYADFSTYMKSLDIDSIFSQAFSSTVYGTAVANLISEEASILSDEVENVALPRFREGMRDINSVMSSTFVVGEAMIEANRIKAISRFSADIRGKLIAVAEDRWKSTLTWNKGVVDTYAQLLKLEISASLDVDVHNADIADRGATFKFRGIQWPIAAVAALTGAMTTTTEGPEKSKVAGALGGALSGAAAGSMFGPWGAGIGAAVGLIGGLFS